MSKIKYRFKSDEEEYMSEDAKKNYRIMNSLKQQLEWVKRQLEYITYQERYTPSLDLKVGEIYEFDFGVNVNCEFSNRHYGVVIANSYENNPLVIVCPLKSNRNGANPCSDINLGYIEGLVTDRETLAIVNQIRSLDKMRLYINPIINEKSIDTRTIRLSDKQIQLLRSGIKKMLT
ncbi:MAG: type II toxin-antitoxin system PemK/MazF family toxin [Erysipelotrichales bacterium]|nr:type II toxin-antitoxin system PemK/MazF family toxin [Erysipelotrichales bacterium]